MDLSSWRASEGLSLEDCCRLLGFGSKGYLSDVENGVVKLPLKRALEIAAKTTGSVDVATLLSDEDAALLAAHVRLASTTDTPAEAAA
jgi:transcriptional regulator with XRE-family HTH domain